MKICRFVIALMVLPALLGACSRDDSEDLSAILAAHREAIGILADDATLAVQATIQKPDYDVEMRVLAARPNLIRYEWHWGESGYHIMASDGRSLWEESSEFESPRLIQEGSERAWLENAGEWLVGVRPLAEIAERGSADITLILAEQSDKPDYHHLTISYNNGNLREVFLDRDDHLVRIVRQGWKKADETIVTESFYDDYIDADGLKFPRTVTERRVDDGAVLSTIRLNKITIKQGQGLDKAFSPARDLNLL